MTWNRLELFLGGGGGGKLVIKGGSYRKSSVHRETFCFPASWPLGGELEVSVTWFHLIVTRQRSAQKAGTVIFFKVWPNDDWFFVRQQSQSRTRIRFQRLRDPVRAFGNPTRRGFFFFFFIVESRSLFFFSLHDFAIYRAPSGRPPQYEHIIS